MLLPHLMRNDGAAVIGAWLPCLATFACVLMIVANKYQQLGEDWRQPESVQLRVSLAVLGSRLFYLSLCLSGLWIGLIAAHWPVVCSLHFALLAVLARLAQIEFRPRVLIQNLVVLFASGALGALAVSRMG